MLTRRFIIGVLGCGLLGGACFADTSRHGPVDIDAGTQATPPPKNAPHADQAAGLNCREISYSRSARDLADIKKTQNMVFSIT